MIIDMHVHEKTHSLDSKMSLNEIIKKGKEIGLNGVCITDHDSMGLKDEIINYRKENKDFIVLLGVEILTYDGDILAFGLNEMPQKKLYAYELIDLVNEQGGVTIAAHPFRKNNRGLEDKIKKYEKLTGIEGLNGNTDFDNNYKSIEIANTRYGNFFGSSDAHNVNNLGKYATKFNNIIKDESDLIKEIKNNNFKPVFFDGKNYVEFNQVKVNEFLRVI